MVIFCQILEKYNDVKSSHEPVGFVNGSAAIVPLRQWHQSKPEIIEMEMCCLIKRNGKWYLLPEFSQYSSRINKLDEEERELFSQLGVEFSRYKSKRKKEARKAGMKE